MRGRVQALPANGFPTKVVGTTFCDEDAIDASLLDVGVLLLRDYANGHDDYAIAVLRADDGTRIGYISRLYSIHLAPFAEYQGLSAIVLDVTGGVVGKENKGVNIYVYEDDGAVLPSKAYMLGEGRRAS